MRVTQQTSTTIPLSSGLPATRGASRHELIDRAGFEGPLQWLLEGSGWTLLRPAVDFMLLCAAVAIALGGGDVALDDPGLSAPLLALPPLVILLFRLRGLYESRLRPLVLDGVVPVVSAVSVAAMAVAVIGVFFNGEVPSEPAWVKAWLFGLVGVGLGRATLALTQRWARGTGRVGKPVLIMGAGMVGSQVARRLESHPEYGLRPVGFLDDDPRSVAEVGGRDVPVLGTVEDLDEIVRETGVEHLIVAFSSVTDERVSRLIQRCQELGIEVSVVPRMFDTINNRIGYDTVGGLPLLSFSSVDPRGVQFALKHALDRVFAAVLLLVLSPLIALIALAVRLSSSGPTLFRQRRVGRDGKIFHLYKFRSMYLERGGPSSAANGGNAVQVELNRDDISALDFILGGDTAPGGVEGDDRRTPLGRLLRRTSLDELPQLFNVLRGEMSLIGPRPERPEFVELFGRDIVRYGDRHRVKSGITGWAQVHGLRGQTSLAERVEWDNYYIAHWSLGLDLKILLLTAIAVFRPAE
ncbi:MAG TPA: exopolysaccharide biosynthesis polyprenyl glycosylphosphotransferase [Solirubrobacteraceae bacterium]|jgi:exopolysaccharide biosynthesis polyprenyl glycosylphosphotransferase|nr:exopolysaccharide biosynthesis polyprenyl glycosylphosphotransferase [Solirubrobacteraceae bacterium]